MHLGVDNEAPGDASGLHHSRYVVLTTATSHYDHIERIAAGKAQASGVILSQTMASSG